MTATFRLLPTAALAACLAAPGWAENFALLVGASTYDNLEKRYDLVGPANDVTLVRTYLQETSPVPFAAGNVLALADGVDGAGKPTLAAIRAAFAELEGRVGPGDFVYLHFSGHGTQAPAIDPDSEIDGLDEMFLPVDIGPWNDTVGTVENALVDDEIGQLIGGLRARGATVWAVFDSCHSGTVTRAGPDGDTDDTRMRKLSPAALGVPDAAMDAVTSRALPPSADPRARPESPAGEALANDGGGAFIAFYAAQTNETTPEKRLPRGAPDRKSQGVFTWTIFETLAENPGLTYRQLGQEILRKYTVQNLALSTPMFEGDLDAYVFSGEAGERVVQWPLRAGAFGLTLRAGTLQGLAEGDILAVLPTAAASAEDALGYVEVAYADTFTAEVEPIAHAGLAGPDLSDLPRGAYARALQQEIDFSLDVALPGEGNAIPTALATALDIVAAEAGARVRFLPAGSEADIHLAVIPDSPRPDAVWMLPGSSWFEPDKAGRVPSIGTEGRSGEEVAALMLDNLERMGRAVNLMRMAGRFGATELGVDLTLRTRSKERRELRDLDAVPVPVLVPDDQVHVQATNTEDFPVDINVLHIGSNYEITHFHKGRMQPGDTLKKGLFRITDEAFGRDRVIVILTPAEPQSAEEDLRFLQQDAIAVTRGNGTRQGSSFAGALREAGFGTTTRGAVALDDEAGPEPAILQFEIDTVPAGG